MSLAAVFLLLLLSSTVSFSSGAQVSVSGAGSSFAADVYNAWAVAFGSSRDNAVKITYAATGSGSGKSQILSSAVDFAGSDEDLSAAEKNNRNSTDVVMFPSFAGAVVIGYNLPGISSGQLVLSRYVTAQIFLGAIRWWNDSQIVALNPSLSLPTQRISIVVRQDKSGTTEAFTSALSQFDPSGFGTVIGVNSIPTWPVVQYYGLQNRGVSFQILANTYSIGYLNPASAVYFDVALSRLINKANNTVSATSGTIQSAMTDFGSVFQSPFRMIATITDAPGTLSWPIASYTYFMVHNTTQSSRTQALEVLRFVNWFLTEAQADSILNDNTMVPLSAALRDRITLILKGVSVNGEYLYDLVPLPKASVSGSSDTQLTGTTLILVAVFSVVGLLVIATLIGFSWYTHKRRVALSRIVSGDSERPPHGDIAIVFTDVQGSTALWEESPVHMQRAVHMHYEIMRELAAKFHGYIVKSEGDSLFLVFQEFMDAVKWTLGVQEAFMLADWPQSICKEQYAKDPEHPERPSVCIFRGLRVRMGIHCGFAEPSWDPSIRRWDFFSPSINLAARVSSAGHGGQIIVSGATWAKLTATDDILRKCGDPFVKFIGFVPLKGISAPELMVELIPNKYRLRSAFFPPPRGNHSASSKDLSNIARATAQFPDQLSIDDDESRPARSRSLPRTKNERKYSQNLVEEGLFPESGGASTPHPASGPDPHSAYTVSAAPSRLPPLPISQMPVDPPFYIYSDRSDV
eukprot:ANDGO_00956.mRNA.1 Phosphate-binding protein PstS